MTSFYIGDIPAEAVIVEPTIAGIVPEDLAVFIAVEVSLYGPNGLVVSDAGLTATIDDETQDVEVSFPSTSVFTAPGLYRVGLVLTATGKRVTADSVTIVSQTDDGWHTLGSARQAFGNDFPEDDVQAWTLLEAAKVSVVEYAPALAEQIYYTTSGEIADPDLPGYLTVVNAGDPIPGTAIAGAVPVTYTQAQLMQARNLLNSIKTDPSTGPDGNSFVIRPYPLDNFIKQLLRPRKIQKWH